MLVFYIFKQASVCRERWNPWINSLTACKLLQFPQAGHQTLEVNENLPADWLFSRRLSRQCLAYTDPGLLRCQPQIQDFKAPAGHSVSRAGLHPWVLFSNQRDVIALLPFSARVWILGDRGRLDAGDAGWMTWGRRRDGRHATYCRTADLETHPGHLKHLVKGTD